MRPLALLLLLALPAYAEPDGGLDVIEVRKALIITPEGFELERHGGAWLDSASLRSVAGELAGCRERAPGESPSLGAVAVVVGLVVLLGAGVGGYVLGRSAK